MTRAGSEDITRIPCYSYREAAHYISVPTSTLRAWCRGTRGGFRPVIDPDGAPGEGLSFLNLVEAYVLAAIRRVHNIPMPRVREALDFVGHRLDIDRPLAHVELLTDGLDLFLKELDSLMKVTRQTGQYAMPPLLDAHLQRIRRDDSGMPIKLYPFTRKDVSPEALRAIEVDPRFAFGRPVLAGRSVPTVVIADRFKAGDTISDIAGDYEVSTDQIEEALRSEFDYPKAA